MSKDMGVMQSDGTFKIESPTDMDNVIQISDDEDSADTVDLRCKICEQNSNDQIFYECNTKLQIVSRFRTR